MTAVLGKVSGTVVVFVQVIAVRGEQEGVVRGIELNYAKRQEHDIVREHVWV